MSPETQMMAGFLLITLPTVAFGGVSILRLWMGGAEYMKNPLRQSLWRAGHAHAGVLLILALVALLYIDHTGLSDTWKWVARTSIASAPIFLPIAFFLSVLPRDVQKPNALINLAYVGAVSLMMGLLILGVGLML
jgi:hypothetical protein